MSRNPYAGSIYGDFAGSLAEADAYAAEHGIKVPRGKLCGESRRANGCYCISIPFKNKAQRAAAIKKIEELGWEEGAWMDSSPSAQARAGVH